MTQISLKRTPPLRTRFAAKGLDGLAVFLVLAGVTIALDTLARGYHMKENLEVLVLLLSYLYLLCGDGFNGQSFGKRIMGIAVVSSKTGVRAHPVQSFGRNILLYTLVPIGPLIELVSIVSSPSRRVGDMIASTAVIDLKYKTRNISDVSKPIDSPEEPQ